MTLRSELGRVADESRAARRDRPGTPADIPFVAVTDSPLEAWLPGKLWLDTSRVGPLGSHPLWVKLRDGSFTHVAWLVLDDA